MAASFAQADRILRGEFDAPELRTSGKLGLGLFAWIGAGGLTYGAVMGCFGGLQGDRLWQVVYSAAKVPLLLVGTFLLCLPSFFVFNTVAGLRRDFSDALRALVGAQAGMTLVLCSFAPFTVLWYLSSDNYSGAIVFNGLAFAAASLAAQRTLRQSYGRLIQRDRRHRLLLHVWVGLYMFVGIQLGWVLRPFVGQPNAPVQWFRADAWGNAYVEVLHHLSHLLLP